MTNLPPIIKEAPPEGTRRILLTVSYDGTNYAGWQLQENAVAVQQRVEEALEKLQEQGLVHKIVTDEGARWQYCHCHQQGRDCFLIKCEQCGCVEHAECDHLTELYGHLAEEHHFRINPRRTLFYGLCQRCAQEDGV